MKLFSDLRLNNAQVTEQFTALVLAGVAAVIIGGVAHMGSSRNQGVLAPLDFAAESAPEALLVNSQPIIPVDAGAADAAPSEDNGVAASMTLPPLKLTAVQVTPALHDAVQAAMQAAGKPEHIVRTVEMSRGGSLSSLLSAEADLEDREVHAVAKALAAVYKGKLPRGLEVSLRFTQLGNEENFEGLSFQPEAASEVRIARLADGSYEATKINTPLERQRSAVEGVIRTSLSEAVAAQGVPRNVMSSMLRAFSHEMDFQRDLHPGDKFRVLYDQPRAKNGQAVGDATIIYAAIETRGVMKSVYRVIYNDGTAEYFNGRGESVRRGLMRTPIDGAHVSSSYGMRRHPILGYSKMHQGVDFAAPTGTPIYAAGDGVVQEVGFRSGYGRFIRIRHRGGLETAYAHMSRFARNIAPGTRVDQGDIIAYVGMSGRATGAHLHFEVRINDRQVNPMSVSTQVAGSRLSGKSLAQFNAGKIAIESEFRRRALTVHEVAKPVKLAANGHAKTASE